MWDLRRLRALVHNGLGGEPMPASAPLHVLVDLAEVSSFDRGDRSHDVVIACVDPVRRIELVRHIMRVATRFEPIYTHVEIDADDHGVLAWWDAGALSLRARLRGRAVLRVAPGPDRQSGAALPEGGR